MCDVKPDHILKSVLRAFLIVEVKCCLPIFQLAESNSTVKSAVHVIDEAYPASVASFASVSSHSWSPDFLQI